MNTLRMTLATAFAPAVWGSTYIVTSQLLPPDHPLFAAWVRAFPAGIIALAFTRSLPRGAWWWKSAVLGILNIGVFFPLLFIAAYRLPGGIAATLGAAQPLIVALLAVGILGQSLSGWRMSWGIAGISGVALVVLQSTLVLDPIGILAGLAGTVSMGLGVTLTKRWGRPAGVPAMALAGWQLTAGGLFLLPLFLAVEGIPQQIDAGAMLGYSWLGLMGGLIGYTLWFRGIKHLPVVAVALLGLASPLVAALLGVLVLGQGFNTMQLLGFSLALAAIVAGQFSPGGIHRPPPTPPRASEAFYIPNIRWP